MVNPFAEEIARRVQRAEQGTQAGTLAQQAQSPFSDELTTRTAQSQVNREELGNRLPTGAEGGLTDLIAAGASIGSSDEIIGTLLAGADNLIEFQQDIGLLPDTREPAQPGTTIDDPEAQQSVLTKGAPEGFEDNDLSTVQQQIDNQRRLVTQALENHPVIGRIVEVAGGLAAGPGQLIRVAGTGIGKRIGAASFEGATFGSIAGFNFAEGDLGTRATAAAEGGAFGLFLGAAIPATAGLVEFLSRPIRNALRSTNPKAAAETAILKSLQDDGIDLSDHSVVVRLRAEATKTADRALIDLGGEKTLRTGKLVDLVPNTRQDEVVSFLAQRQFAQGERVAEDFGRILGDEDTFLRTMTDLGTQREVQAAPFYTQAFDSGAVVNTTPVISFINREIPKAAGPIQKMLKSVRKELVTKSGGQKTGIEPLHNVKTTVLDDDIARALRQGKTNRARLMVGIKTRLVKAIEAASPEYAKGRAIYASAAASEEAVMRGRAFLKGSAIPDIDIIQNMAAGELEFFRMGLAQGLRDIIEGRNFGNDMVKAIFGNEKKVKILRAAFPSRAEFNAFRDLMNIRAKETQVNQSIRGGSATAKNLGILEEADGSIRIINAAKSGGVVGALMEALSGAFSRAQGISPKMVDELADMLFNADPVVLQETIRRLSERAGQQTRKQLRSQARENVGVVIRRTGSVGGGLTAGELSN